MKLKNQVDGGDEDHQVRDKASNGDGVVKGDGLDAVGALVFELSPERCRVLALEGRDKEKGHGPGDDKTHEDGIDNHEAWVDVEEAAVQEEDREFAEAE